VTVELAGLGKCDDWSVEFLDPVEDGRDALRVVLEMRFWELDFRLPDRASAHAVIEFLDTHRGQSASAILVAGTFLGLPLELRKDAKGADRFYLTAGAGEGERLLLRVEGQDTARFMTAWRDAVDDLDS